MHITTLQELDGRRSQILNHLGKSVPFVIFAKKVFSTEEFPHLMSSVSVCQVRVDTHENPKIPNVYALLPLHSKNDFWSTIRNRLDNVTVFCFAKHGHTHVREDRVHDFLLVVHTARGVNGNSVIHNLLGSWLLLLRVNESLENFGAVVGKCFLNVVEFNVWVQVLTVSKSYTFSMEWIFTCVDYA